VHHAIADVEVERRRFGLVVLLEKRALFVARAEIVVAGARVERERFGLVGLHAVALLPDRCGARARAEHAAALVRFGDLGLVGLLENFAEREARVPTANLVGASLVVEVLGSRRIGCDAVAFREDLSRERARA